MGWHPGVTVSRRLALRYFPRYIGLRILPDPSTDEMPRSWSAKPWNARERLLSTVVSDWNRRSVEVVMDERLTKFVDQARQRGLDHAAIFLLLRSSGWKERQIADALAARDVALPIPERAGMGSARDAFLHLVAFTALYASAISLILLLFAYIGFWFPDPEMRTSTYAVEAALSGIRAEIATLIVSYPLFLLVWTCLLREIRQTPEKAKGGVRRWLSFLSLFAGAVTIMTDVICVVYYLVEGDLTVHFLLKVLALLVITGAIFLYLLLVLRSESESALSLFGPMRCLVCARPWP